MIGKLKYTGLMLDGVDLMSDTYRFIVEGLFDNYFKHYEADLYSDGSSLSHLKLQNKQLVLNGYVKTDNPKDILFINKLLGLDGENGKTVNFNIKEMKLLDKGDQASNLSQLNFLASV